MYGYTASDEDDRIVKLVGEAMTQFSEMVRTNAFLVDVFPMREFHHRLVIIIFGKISAIVRFVPDWLPGAAWKRKVPKYRKTLLDTVNLPYDWVKQQIVRSFFLRAPFFRMTFPHRLWELRSTASHPTSLIRSQPLPTKNILLNGQQQVYILVCSAIYP